MSQRDPATSVRIWGEEFRVAGATPERVRELAEFVDRRFREEQAARPSMDLKRLAVVVCLTIAEELYDERARGRAMEAEAVRRVRRCREALEGAHEELPTE